MALLVAVLAAAAWLAVGAAGADRSAGAVRIAAAGDIACDPESSRFRDGRGEGLRCRQMATSNLLVRGRYAAVLALGDLQYEDGAFGAFMTSYHPSWGRVKRITKPVPGNHEYHHPRAAGYFRYFDRTARDPGKGYYSYDVGQWHVVALNSNCAAVGGCGRRSPQTRWLRDDLAAHRRTCVLAYWHQPRFSSGRHGSNTSYRPFWRALYEANADVVLNGHDHNYERFAAQTPSGMPDPVRGIRQFVVGTGGASVRSFETVEPNSEVRDASSLGILELTLKAGGYSWRFRPAVGSFTDSGSASCH